MKKHFQQLKTKLLSTYYGNPGRDLKVICVTGTTGKKTVLHYIHDILEAAGHKVDALEASISVSASELHNFLHKSRRNGSEFAIVMASAQDLKKQVFHNLPVYAVVMTDCVPANAIVMTNEERIEARKSLFHTAPAIVVLNADDPHYPDFAKYAGSKATLTYGTDHESDIRINHTKIYRQGTEAVLSINHTPTTVATFVVGETAVPYMACATALGVALKIDTKDIVSGLGEYDPEN